MTNLRNGGKEEKKSIRWNKKGENTNIFPSLRYNNLTDSEKGFSSPFFLQLSIFPFFNDEIMLSMGKREKNSIELLSDGKKCFQGEKRRKSFPFQRDFPPLCFSWKRGFICERFFPLKVFPSPKKVFKVFRIDTRRSSRRSSPPCSFRDNK